jgi:quinol monooxygenase YgiN
MIKVFIKHKVENASLWRVAFDNFLAQRQSAGELSYSIGHVPNELNTICIIFEWDTADNASVFLKSQELKEAMQAATVIEEPEIFIFEVTSEGETNT